MSRKSDPPPGKPTVDLGERQKVGGPVLATIVRTPLAPKYSSVPYITNLLMDPMEKLTPDSEEFAYEGGKFVAEKLWAPTAAGPFLAAHLKSSTAIAYQQSM